MEDSEASAAKPREVLVLDDAWARAFIESAVDGIIAMNEDGTVEFCNPAAASMFGYSADEIVGQNVGLLMPESDASKHSHYVNRYKKEGESRVVGRGREVMARRRDDSTFPIFLSVCVAEVGGRRVFVGNIHDLGPLRAALDQREAALRSLNKRNMEMAGLFQVGEALRSGKAMDQVFQDIASLVGSACQFPKLVVVRIRLDEAVHLSDGFCETPWRMAADVIVAGRPRGIVEAFYKEQATEQNGAAFLQEEVDLVQALAHMLAGTVERREGEAQVIQASKLASIGELAAGVSHEINNPVNGILNCADILLAKLPPESKEHQFASLIRMECERIANIVGSLLTFSGQHAEDYEPANLADVVESVLRLSRKKMTKSHIDLHVDVADSLPDVQCRGDQLQQVVMNLLINALQALDARYPNLDTEKKLTIMAAVIEKDDMPWVRLTVRDQGVGIASTHIDRIFDPFFTTKGREKGTGLGLSVSSGIVQDHGGSIVVESDEGKGAAFHVDLPACDSAPNGGTCGEEK